MYNTNMVHLDSDVELSGYWPSFLLSQGAREDKRLQLLLFEPYERRITWLNNQRNRWMGGDDGSAKPRRTLSSLRRRSTLESSPYLESLLTWMGRANRSDKPWNTQPLKDLPSGGWLWCGAIVAHRNGDLYAVNGRYFSALTINATSSLRENSFLMALSTDWWLCLTEIITRNLDSRRWLCMFLIID